MILPSDSAASLVLGIAAALAYAVPALAPARVSPRIVRSVLLAAWVLHGAVVMLTLLIESPRFGFAPALSVTGWLALTIYGIESRMFPDLQAQRALAALGGVVVLLALVFPGAALHVGASPWLPVHLALGVASYGLFTAAVIHAWLMRRAEKQMRLAGTAGSGLPLLTLERLTFQFVMAGFALLSATLLFGWLFGESLYGPGRAWRWDHKTIFSLLAWFTFALLLVGRSRFGWRGRKAVRVLYVGAGLLLLGYAGSRFVLEVILERRL
jgi:ABC-type uncharacterized transport system permease subunit